MSSRTAERTGWGPRPLKATTLHQHLRAPLKQENCFGKCTWPSATLGPTLQVGSYLHAQRAFPTNPQPRNSCAYIQDLFWCPCVCEIIIQRDRCSSHPGFLRMFTWQRAPLPWIQTGSKLPSCQQCLYKRSFLPATMLLSALWVKLVVPVDAVVMRGQQSFSPTNETTALALQLILGIYRLVKVLYNVPGSSSCMLCHHASIS